MQRSPNVGVHFTLRRTLCCASALLAASVFTGCSATEPQAQPQPAATPSAASSPPAAAPTQPEQTTTTVAETPQPPPLSWAFPIDAPTDFADEHHHYPAADLWAACDAPVVSPVDGVVSGASTVDTWNRATNLGPARGGISVAIDAGGVRYYMSHFATLDTQVGASVTAGQALGTVGETGSAQGTGCHIHFGLSSTECSVDDWWTRRGQTSPYQALKAWQRGEQFDPAQAVAAGHEREGCPTEPTTYD